MRNRPSGTAAAVRFRLFDTPFGTAAFAASERGLARVYLPSRSAAQLRRSIRQDDPDAREDGGLLESLARDLDRYFAGLPVRFDVRFDWPGATPFQSRVWKACHAIPYGRTLSYAELGAKAGAPGAARAVGMAMGSNRCPIVVPCHRVLRSDGTIGGYSGPGGVDFKMQLLELESAGAAAR